MLNGILLVICLVITGYWNRNYFNSKNSGIGLYPEPNYVFAIPFIIVGGMFLSAFIGWILRNISIGGFGI